MEKEEYWTTVEVAEFLDVNINKVYEWLKAGLIRSYQLPGTKKHRFKPADVRAFLDGCFDDEAA